MVQRATDPRQRRDVRSHTIALFPGAFRPPHAAHFAAVLDLAQRPEVDEVVVLIANRNRTLPGTTLAIDAQAAAQLWSIFLDAGASHPSLTKVRTVIAEHSAIQAALDHLEQAQPGTTLYFCIGESDLAHGDPRFANLAAGAAQRGVCARIIPAPTGDFAIRATDLRSYLAKGEAGCEPFMAALPAHLSTAQRHAAWHCCRQALRDIPALLQEKVTTILTEAGFPAASQLRIVNQGKIDPVFQLQASDGRRLYVKYAGDTVGEGVVGDPLEPKSRRRLGTERRALNYLHGRLLANQVDVPHILHFDKTTRTLVLSEVCPGGYSLHDALAHGHFDAATAARIGALLALLHRPDATLRPFWGEAETDLAQWRTMLTWRTTLADDHLLATSFGDALVQLRQCSDEARRPGFFHLDLVPKNIRLAAIGGQMGRNQHADSRIGIIDCEFCTNVGDPAYDLGLLLGHYLFWGIATNRWQQCSQALQTLVATYQVQQTDCSVTILARAKGFAAITLLNQAALGPKVNRNAHARMLETATKLMGAGVFIN